MALHGLLCSRLCIKVGGVRCCTCEELHRTGTETPQDVKLLHRGCEDILIRAKNITALLCGLSESLGECRLLAQVLLLDEITVDMDVVGRLDLLKFFTEECEVRGATIIYATHIFDGLEKWVTHVAYLADGHLKIGELPLQMSGLALHPAEKQRATLEGVRSLIRHLASALDACSTP